MCHVKFNNSCTDQCKAPMHLDLHAISFHYHVIKCVYITYLQAGASCLLLGPPGSNWCFSFAPELVGYSAPRDLHRRAAYSICESWFLIHQDVYHDLFVCS